MFSSLDMSFDPILCCGAFSNAHLPMCKFRVSDAPSFVLNQNPLSTEPFKERMV